MGLLRRAAVVATGWLGDTIACSAAAASLKEERGFEVDFFIKWPQLLGLLQADPRYQTRIYTDTRWGLWQLRRSFHNYHLIVREPERWSYLEPFTCEIRRLAGCSPVSSYTLPRPALRAARSRLDAPAKPLFEKPRFEKSLFEKPLLCLARDLYKRAYGRDVDDLVRRLAETFTLVWVGLAPGKSSKRGRHRDVTPDAALMCQSDGFVGPEGGLLWLATGLGVRCAYFTEHIAHLAGTTGHGDPWRALGSVNLCPEGEHLALPAHCSNQEAHDRIHELFTSSRDRS